VADGKLPKVVEGGGFQTAMHPKTKTSIRRLLSDIKGKLRQKQQSAVENVKEPWKMARIKANGENHLHMWLKQIETLGVSLEYSIGFGVNRVGTKMVLRLALKSDPSWN